MAAWTEDEDVALRRGIESGLQYRELAETIGRSENAVRNRAFALKIGKSAAKQRADARQQIANAAIAPDIQIDKDAIIRELEQKVARLTQQLTWAQHAKSDSRTGGLLTLRRSDDHYGDANHLASCCRSLEVKFLEIVRQYEPDRIQIVAGDDWVAGRGIYKEQDLDSVVPDANQQCQLGAWKARRFLQEIREISAAPIHWHVMRGNHDFANGHSLTPYLFLLLKDLNRDIADVAFQQHVDMAVVNLASQGTYHVLVRHGFGHSKLSPNSSSFIEAVKDEIIAMQRKMQPHEQIRRILSGHTHWLNVDTERLPGLHFDTTGGMQRNTRVRLGANQRPTGWIAYASPQGLDSEILAPIPLVPDEEVVARESKDPNLPLANKRDAAECLAAYSALLEDRGELVRERFGELTEGRW